MGCTAAPQKKLSNHLKRKHSNLSKELHDEALRSAKTVRTPGKSERVGPLPLKGQTSLLEFGRRVAPREEDEEVTAKGTRHFPSFEVGKGGQIDSFLTWLTGVEGKMRGERVYR